MEKTADRYAANLLIPPPLRPVLAKLKRLTFQTVTDVANRFSVSRILRVQIQITRWARFSPPPCWFAMVCRDGSGSAVSMDVASHWFPQEQLDPDSFAFDVLFKGQ